MVCIYALIDGEFILCGTILGRNIYTLTNIDDYA